MSWFAQILQQKRPDLYQQLLATKQGAAPTGSPVGLMGQALGGLPASQPAAAQSIPSKLTTLADLGRGQGGLYGMIGSAAQKVLAQPGQGVFARPKMGMWGAPLYGAISSAAQQGRGGGMVRLRAPDGHEQDVPAMFAQHYLSRGAQRIG